MTNRHKALQLVDDAIERIESGSTDTQDMMAYALVLILVDISEQLEKIVKQTKPMSPVDIRLLMKALSE